MLHSEDGISYAEHINPKKGFAIAGMEYEEYIDIKKNKLKELTYDQILNYLKDTKKEDRLEKYKLLEISLLKQICLLGTIMIFNTR